MRAWAEVNLDAISKNLKNIRKITNPSAKLLAVVKADAYGHGFLDVSKTMIESGADYLGVATFEEAKQLRIHSIDVPIMIIGPIIDSDIENIIKLDIISTVFDIDTAKRISDRAKLMGKNAKIHIKLDTGMTRIGFVCDGDNIGTIESILNISKMPSLEIEGIFTHFARADEKDASHTHMQFEKFMNVCNALEENGLHIPIKHVCNSGGIIEFPQYHLDMVRCGIICYGHYPSNEVHKERLPLETAMAFKTVVTNVKDVPKNTPISYGGTFVTDKKMKIATIAIGYADGYSRVLSNKAEVIINGQKAKLVGNICMDQAMADVSDIDDVKIGDEVILFGKSGNNMITVESVADIIGTINYEILCVVGKRVPRVYIKNGKFTNVLNYLV